MDDGPFRVPRSGDGRVAGRQAPAYRQPVEEESLPEVEEPKPVRRAPTTVHVPIQEKKSAKRFLRPLIGLVILAFIITAGFLIFSNMRGGASAIDTSKYQAVFFTNGQVYFGKLELFNDEYLKLTDIYYLQTQASDETDTSSLQKASSDQSNVQLIKLGSEVHGPEDEMIISKDQVLFYENLKTDGTVAESIQKHKNSN